MTMVNKSHRVLTLFLAIFMLISLVAPMSVFADLESWGTNNVTITVDGGVLTNNQITKAIDLANQKGGFTNARPGELSVEIEGIEHRFLKASGDDILIDKTVWKAANKDKITNSFQNFVDALCEQGNDPDAIQTVMDNIGNKDSEFSTIMLLITFDDVHADLYKAYKIMEPFLNILNVVLGIGCVLLILILMLSTVFDLAYIGLPVWREAQESNGKGKKNPFGVSYEAMRTVQEVEKGLGGGDGDYRNAYLLYFKRRALTYIILALCIMYLICGGLSGIIGFVLSLTTGITG